MPDTAARRRYYGGRGERSRPSDDSRRHRTVALKISGGTVALENVELTSGYVGHNNKHNPALYITGGNLTVTGSTFTGKVVVFCENPNTHPTLSIKHATLNNGILYGVMDAQASDAAGLKAIFADGSMRPIFCCWNFMSVK